MVWNRGGVGGVEVVVDRGVRNGYNHAYVEGRNERNGYIALLGVEEWLTSKEEKVEVGICM